MTSETLAANTEAAKHLLHGSVGWLLKQFTQFHNLHLHSHVSAHPPTPTPPPTPLHTRLPLAADLPAWHSAINWLSLTNQYVVVAQSVFSLVCF